MKIYGVSSQVVKLPPKREVKQQEMSYSQITCCNHNNIENNGVSQIACASMQAQAINFGYRSILKDLFKEGKMPSVTTGIYGDFINSENVSLEHLRPHSQGGRNTLSNYALASIEANGKRGNKPLAMFLNNEMLENYLEQFNFNIRGVFNGYTYQDMIRKTCEGLGVGSEKLEMPKVPVLELPKSEGIIKVRSEERRVGKFFAKGFATGKCEIKFEWRF